MQQYPQFKCKPMPARNVISQAREQLIETQQRPKRNTIDNTNPLLQSKDENTFQKNKNKRLLPRAQSAALVEKNNIKQIVSPKKEMLSPSTSTKFRINRSRNSSREKIEKINLNSPKKTKVKEDVKIGELIGQGAYSKVYRGLLVQGKFIAVKIFNKPNIMNANEINLLSRLKHPNIVSYFGCIQDDSTLKIYLEYMSGGSIAERLKKYGGFSESLTKKFVIQVINGLIYLHNQGIVHRDLKGANILSDEKGNVKLADFGSSKIISELKNISQSEFCNSMKGSLYWMAPELLQQQPHGRRVDIWSLGCTIIEMLTAKHPWTKCRSFPELVCQVVTKKIPLLPENISNECKNFLQSCLVFDKSKRPSAIQLKQHQWIISQ